MGTPAWARISFKPTAEKPFPAIKRWPVARIFSRTSTASEVVAVFMDTTISTIRPVVYNFFEIIFVLVIWPSLYMELSAEVYLSRTGALL